MPPGFVLALDQGTTGSTALVVDPEGAVRARGYAEVPQHYPRPGWVEHDPQDLWTTVERAARQALSAAGITGDDLAAIGIANQRETTIVWDRTTGAPLHRAIVWQCRRTAAVCDRLRAEGHEAMVRARTGLVLDAGIAGDQQAALFGQACFKPGEAKNTYGTGCFALLNTGERPVVSSHGLLTTLAWRIGGRTTYALEGAVFVAGAAVQWLRDGLGIIANAAETDALARSVPDAGGVYFVPAFVGLGAPYWDQHARGTILGLTRGTTRAHLARAALEAIAFQSRDVLEAMAADAKATLPRLRVDGGAVANHFLCQFQADVLDAPVDRPAVIETTGLGAAYLAGLGVGLWRSLDALAERHAVERTFLPAMAMEERAERYEKWKRAVERARAWATSSSPI